MLDFTGIKPAPLPETNDTLLGAWHVNTEVIGRYRFLIFLNDKSLYCLVTVIPSTEKTVPLTRLFRHLLATAMLRNGVDQAHIEQVAREYVEEIITKTDNRKVLGILVYIFHQMCFYMEDAMDAGRPVDLPEMEAYLNDIPYECKGTNGRFPVLEFKRMLGAG